MRVTLPLSFLLLVPGWAHADEPAHAVAGASVPREQRVGPGLEGHSSRAPDDAAFAHTLEVRVAEVLDRSVTRATERAMRALEARAEQHGDHAAPGRPEQARHAAGRVVLTMEWILRPRSCFSGLRSSRNAC
jgi:hypothetical protein